MFRVITKYNEDSAHVITEHGPWHESEEVAQFWANELKRQGYTVEIENQNKDEAPAKKAKDDNADLAAALASLA